MGVWDNGYLVINCTNPAVELEANEECRWVEQETWERVERGTSIDRSRWGNKKAAPRGTAFWCICRRRLPVLQG